MCLFSLLNLVVITGLLVFGCYRWVKASRQRAKQLAEGEVGGSASILQNDIGGPRENELPA